MLINLEKSIWDITPDDIYYHGQETIIVIFYNQPKYPSHGVSSSDNIHISTLAEAEEAIADVRRCMNNMPIYSHWLAVLIRDGMTDTECSTIMKDMLAQWLANSVGINTPNGIEMAKDTINRTMRRLQAPLN